jgi:predicted transposase YdaD
LILNHRNQDLGSEISYEDLLDNRVQRLFLSDLLNKENLSPNLALLKLIITPENQAVSEANRILESAENQAQFKVRLDLVEAILVNKFPKLSIEEIQKMINLREADVTQTRFYQQVLQIGEVNMVIRQLTRRCGNVSESLQAKVRSLSIPQLESLGEALLDFKGIEDLENWLSNHASN